MKIGNNRKELTTGKDTIANRQGKEFSGNFAAYVGDNHLSWEVRDLQAVCIFNDRKVQHIAADEHCNHAADRPREKADKTAQETKQ